MYLHACDPPHQAVSVLRQVDDNDHDDVNDNDEKFDEDNDD